LAPPWSSITIKQGLIGHLVQRALEQGWQALRNNPDLPQSVADDHRECLTNLQLRLWVKRDEFVEIEQRIQEKLQTTEEQEFVRPRPNVCSCCLDGKMWFSR